MKSNFFKLKFIADVLTSFRLFISLLIILTGLIWGKDGLSVTFVLLLIGWITDVFDGFLARRDKEGKQTWIGENDLIVDVILAFSMIIYFTESGIISLWVSLFYFAFLILVTFVFTAWSLFATYIGLSYGLCLLISYLYAPLFWWLFLIYIAVVLLVTWDHCWENIRAFFSGFSEIEAREPFKKWLV